VDTRAENFGAEVIQGRDLGDENDARYVLEMTSGPRGEMFTVRFLWCDVHGWINERFIYLHSTCRDEPTIVRGTE
jgi:hypothetical protein